MGTNYYLITKDEKYQNKLGSKCEIIDTPYYAYSLHLMKNSCSWLNLFEYHQGVIESVKDIKKLYDTGDFEIYDEYSRKIDWKEFEQIYISKYKNGKSDKLKSHITAQACKTLAMYFTDSDGYEFTSFKFS